VKANVRWAGGLTFVGEGPRGRAIVMDSGDDVEGWPSTGNSPLELLLIGAGACAAIDVVSILKKARQRITGCEVEVSVDRADTDPRRFLNLHQHFVVTGNSVAEKHVARAVELSMTKYCSASATFAEGIPVTHDFEIREAGEQGTS